MQGRSSAFVTNNFTCKTLPMKTLNRRNRLIDRPLVRFKTPSQDLNIEQELKKCYRAIRYCQTFSNFTQPKPWKHHSSSQDILIGNRSASQAQKPFLYREQDTPQIKSLTLYVVLKPICMDLLIFYLLNWAKGLLMYFWSCLICIFSPMRRTMKPWDEE